MDITELTYTKFGKIIFTIISYLKIEMNTNANDLHFFSYSRQLKPNCGIQYNLFMLYFF